MSPFLGAGVRGAEVHPFLSPLSRFWTASLRLEVMPAGWLCFAAPGTPRPDALFSITHFSVLEVLHFLKMFLLLI